MEVDVTDFLLRSSLSSLCLYVATRLPSTRANINMIGVAIVVICAVPFDLIILKKIPLIANVLGDMTENMRGGMLVGGVLRTVILGIILSLVSGSYIEECIWAAFSSKLLMMFILSLFMQTLKYSV